MSNARMQQAFSLLLALLGTAWLAGCVVQGRWAWAPVALLLWVPQAPLLALECLWAALVARRDGARRPLGAPDATPQPYPPLGVWVRAWMRETVASLQTFCWRQPWAHDRWGDHLPPDAQGRRGVLLVHGFVCNRGFWNPWMAKLRMAGVPHVAVTMSPPFDDIACQAQALQPAWEALLKATGVPPLLVGHSMGGLAIRSWLARQADVAQMLPEVITIGTPHHGTALAVWAQSTAAMQMQVLSPFLCALGERESVSQRARFTCYWSVCDNIVFPASTATLPGARHVALPGRAHVDLASDPAILRDVLERTVPSGSKA